MRYATVCSGIEAPSAAWRDLDWKPVFFSEIEPFPRAVLAHHYPDVPIHGDFTTIQRGDYADISLLAAGTPCQDFSVAGLRAGLDGARGGLAMEFVSLAVRLRPRWLVWENVPGLLSIDGGRAFGLFLRALGERGGYGLAYRVLNAQHFGVPQRRRRVFVVGYLGDYRPAQAVLFEPESLRGDPPPRREAGKTVAPTIASRPTGGGGLGTDFDCDGGLIAETLRQHPRPGSNTVGQIVTHSLRADGFDASEDGTGRGTPLVAVPIHSDASRANSRALTPSPDAEGRIRLRDPGLGVGEPGDPMFSLTATAPHAIAFGIDSDCIDRSGEGASQTAGERAGLGIEYELAQPIRSKQPGAVAFDMRGREGGAMPEGPHDTANIRAASGGSSRSYVAFSTKDHGGDAGEVAPTHRAMGHNGSHANAGGQLGIAHGAAVRRLTPRECERLQGFPDDYTLIPFRGKPATDGNRYRALGNSMAVPVVRWIGERIQMVEELIQEKENRP